MKSFVLSLGIVLLPVLTLGSAFRRGFLSATPQTPTSQAKESSMERSPVLVELFTSEGCSSCPPADALLAQLVAQQPVAGAHVIPLEEHVDYWNGPGWFDPFSSWEFTERQQEYGRKFDTGSVYTPQMIVDGHSEFVGSRGSQARQSIAQAAQQAKTAVRLTLAQGDPRAAALQVSVGRLAGATPKDKAEVFLAITEAGLHSNVKGGENAGEDLHHAPVVRVLRKIGQADPLGDTAFASSQSLSLSGSWKRENLRAVVFIQEKKSRRILGAASIPLA